MFARQLAVMKGQAWNVVETLKTTDHGPLELTRRARVYVWDDIVDIPVAVPLRPPSTETRRRRAEDAQKQPDTEEMDISAANAPNGTAQHDLLGLGTSSSDFPSPNRFVVARPNGVATRDSHDGGRISLSPSSPATVDGFSPDSQRQEDISIVSRLEASEPALPTMAKWRSGPKGEDDSRREPGHPLPKHRRSSSGPMMNGLLHEEDLEGDLGYAAAAGMEKNQRRVIVERLENVKSKNPVFTWC